MSARVRYDRLTRDARDTIRWAGLSIAAYIRDAYPDGDWRGDACGCTDDRCIDYHHDAPDDCGCLPALLEMGPRDGSTWGGTR